MMSITIGWILGQMLDALLFCPVAQLAYSGGSRKFWWGGDLKHKTSKIRMSSPKLRLIFWPKSEIQPFFSPKFRWSPKKKKKKKVFTTIESDFSAEIGDSNVFSPMFRWSPKKKKKKKRKKGLHQH